MTYPQLPYAGLPISQPTTVLEADYEIARRRRSIRHFSDKSVPREAIETAIRIAGTAPSGANRQPWFFVAIGDPEIKARIRREAEREEKDFYENRAPADWLEALAPLGTDFHKAYLEIAPWIIVVFRRDFDLEGERRLKNYYMTESVGIAVGFLIQALHRAGLCALTHTPAPMTFLREICGRPANEKPFLLMPVGYAAEDCVVPDISRKPIADILQWNV